MPVKYGSAPPPPCFLFTRLLLDGQWLDDVGRLGERLAGLLRRRLARPLHRPLLPGRLLLARVAPLALLPQALLCHLPQQQPVAPLPPLAAPLRQPLLHRLQAAL